MKPFWRDLRFRLSLGLLFSFSSAHAIGPYIEAGTSIGTISSGDSYFKQTGASGSAFIGSLSLYAPITSEKRFFHFDLGLQNRLTTGSASSGSSLAMATTNLAFRLEIFRLFVGAGYSPLTFSSSASGGITSLHTYSGTSSHFLEGGAIWRVIPELQIVAAAGLEYGALSGGVKSPNPITEYGLRFRFPLNPVESSRAAGVDFDGFRYPFGFMK